MGLVEKVTSKGILYSFGIIFNRIIPEWLFRCRRYVVFAMKSGDEIDVQPDADNGIVIKWCESESEYRSIEQLTYFSREHQTFPAKACMAVEGERTVAGFWYAIDGFVERELGVQYTLKPEQTWLFAARVDNDFRIRGIHQRVLKFTVSELNALGYAQVLLAVNPNNKASMHVHQKHAKKIRGSVFAVRLLNMTCCFISGNGISGNRAWTLNCKKSPVVIEMTV